MINPIMASSRDLYRWQNLGPVTGGSRVTYDHVLLQRDDRRYELFTLTARTMSGGLVTLWKQTSGDAINWSVAKKIAEVMTMSPRLLAVHQGGRSVVMIARSNVYPTLSALKVFREAADGGWEESPWLDSVGGNVGDLAYHPRWGYVLAWLARTEHDPKLNVYVIYGQSLDPLLRHQPSKATREWEAGEWFRYGRSFEREGKKQQAAQQFRRVVTQYGDTHWAAVARKRLQALAGTENQEAGKPSGEGVK